MLNGAKALHNEVPAFGGEPFFSWLCTLCFTVFFLQGFPVMLMHAELPFMGMQARADSAVPAPSLALLRHCCALLSASGISQHVVKDGSNRVVFE